MTNKIYKFRGGFWLGGYANTWPNGILEFDQNKLILHDLMFKKQYALTKKDIQEIKIISLFKILTLGIRIDHSNRDFIDRIYFWYFPSKKFSNALRECGWL